MNIAVASGKGGTGKTMVTASMASVWDGPVTVMDLDVEEPNLHLFLKPEIEEWAVAELEVPAADESKCTKCRACADLCQFAAIKVMGDILLTFPDMCHGCGGCLAVCPEKALFPGKRELGQVGWGRAGAIGFLMGRLRVGEAMSPPLMREVKAKWKELPDRFPGDLLVDAPPGVSCPAVNAVLDSDYVVLVTEPTPFGFHDLKLAHEAFRPLGKTMGVVVNRAGLGDRSVYDFCGEAGLPILAEIPFDRQLAEAYAQGEIPSQISDSWKKLFVDLAGQVKSAARAVLDIKEAAHA